MLFSFLNAEATAQALIESSSTFRQKHLLEADAVIYVKERAVELFTQHYSAASSALQVNDGVVQVPVWKDVGVTFFALGDPKQARGEEWPVGLNIPGVTFVVVNFWVSLPLTSADKRKPDTA